MGAAHARAYAAHPGVSLAAVCDRDRARGETVAAGHGVPWLDDHRRLIGQVEAVSVCVPTDAHYAVTADLLAAGIPVLLEKPIAARVAEARRLVRLSRREKVLLQIGHVERFNPAVSRLAGELVNPRFLEIHRLGPFKNRGIDVSVVTDLMIHDIDLVLELVPATVRRVDALGIAAFTRAADIATARLFFRNGVVANLTASRISDKSLRKVRVFEDDKYWSLDCERQALACYRKNPAGQWRRKAQPEVADLISRADTPVTRAQPLALEIASFIRAVETGDEPEVTGEDGLRALDLARRIEKCIRLGPATDAA